MGLKLKSQIAGILFLLFLLTVLILGYFNMSILFVAMRSLAEEQSGALAANVVSWVQKSLPDEGYSPEYLRLRMAQRGDLADHLREIKGLRCFRITDAKGEVIYATGPQASRIPVRPAGIETCFRTHRAAGWLWEYDSAYDDVGHPLRAGGLALPRIISYEYYAPVLVHDVPVAAYQLSLAVEEMPRRLRVLLLGNVLLSMVFLITAFIAISIWTAHAINRPLELIMHAQERIGRGDFTATVQLDLPSTNEIVTICASFNRMAADLRRFQKELEVKTRRLEELNAEYRRLNERLETEVEEKTRELKEFFSVVTHDMKVPLAAIQGYTDLLLRSRAVSLSEKQLRYIQSVGTATTHLLGLTRNMLETVKYDAGKITYYMEDFDLQALVEEVRSQVAQLLEEKGLAMEAEIPLQCRGVHADRTKIAQVITNLLNNAVKFTPEGGTIDLRARPRDSVVEVSVADTGSGLLPDQVPLLFEKFTQFHTVDGASSSLGLGLYIVRKILEGHAQTVRVDSSPGRGSCFVFTLARGHAPPGDVAADEKGEPR